jgi:hypothetical protein
LVSLDLVVWLCIVTFRYHHGYVMLGSVSFDYVWLCFAVLLQFVRFGQCWLLLVMFGWFSLRLFKFGNVMFAFG